MTIKRIDILPIVPAQRRAKVFSDHGTEYLIRYHISKKHGLDSVQCNCPGAEKGYCCRHLKDFVSGELCFCTQMPDKEKRRVRNLLENHIGSYPMKHILYMEILKVRYIEKQLESTKVEVERLMKESYERAQENEKREETIRARIDGDARWRLMLRVFDKFLDGLEAIEPEPIYLSDLERMIGMEYRREKDLVDSYLALEQLRRETNKYLHENYHWLCTFHL